MLSREWLNYPREGAYLRIIESSMIQTGAAVPLVSNQKGEFVLIIITYNDFPESIR